MSQPRSRSCVSICRSRVLRFFYARTFVPGRRALHTSECLFFTRSSTLKVSDSFGLGAHIRVAILHFSCSSFYSIAATGDARSLKID